jgi:superfamily II DNA or RNA helicase
VPKAQHPKAASFARQNLFAGLASFAELESRIAALPYEQSRGAAFEVFAEAFLATQRKHDAATVWPLASVPTQTLQTLGLATQDYGVDGVFQTLLGHFNAYQVKFRTGRPALTWRELSTFMGLADSPHIRSRVLLTNCDDLPSVLNERQGFFCIRGSDLDRLDADDFRAIEAWLADAAFTAPKKQPQPHQIEGLDALLPALETHDRVSAIMACGTGKTLLALWIAEHVARASSPAGSGGVPAARILVLVPSLALLRQTLHEWLRETSLPSLAYLCVCSDPTVKEGLDSIATAQSDLDFQVSTDTASVRDFLDAPFTGTKIVFCTYQSAPVVGEALKPGEAFDLGVFDEAHKTAGREGRNYAFALEDANLPIRKRLLLTATPRHYNPQKRDQEGDAQLVFSMDNPAVYGPQAYRLTFAEAARRGIICGYKVIISVITSEMVTNELLSRGEVLVNGDAVRARQVANQIALCDAIERYGASKAFTFHRTVASAASFVAASSEGIRTHLPEFETFHVNGTMPTARREREMRDFRAAARAVMSNARCLTEGVDVPAVDMVAFLSPRRSRVDIVQATGRAMRRSPGKTTGYVLVPLYVELATGETVEAAVNRAEFDEIWDVLQSMQEQDDVLAGAIREMRLQKGRRLGYNDAGFRERIEIRGPQLDLDRIRAAVTTTCIENLGGPWDEHFGELVAYIERFGDCDVPTRWKENRLLATWVVGQRQARKLGELTAEKIEKLDQIGFFWDPLETLWLDYLEQLAAFRRTHGHSNPSQLLREEKRLGAWVAKLRLRRGAGLLSAERIAQLDALGMIWSPRDDAWQRMFSELAEYHRKHGHAHVSTGDVGKHRLAHWLTVQRRRHRERKLSEEQIKLLTNLEIDWDPEASSWEAMFQSLVDFKQRHRHFRVPRPWPEQPSLPNWVIYQRRLYKKNALSEERVRRMNGIGFPWSPRESLKRRSTAPKRR